VAVAVLYVNYLVYEDLDRSLHALAPFLDQDDAVVVVDNASDAARLEWISRRHPRVTFLPQRENLGFAAGVNLAARHTSQPYLLLLNPDTVMQGTVVRTLERWLRDHPGVGVAGPRVLNADGSVQASARRSPSVTAAIGGRSSWLTRRFPNNWISRRHILGRSSSEPLEVDWIAGSCLMTTREAFERVDGLDEAFFLYWEDADYCLRLKAAGFKSAYVPLAAVLHAGGHSATLVPDLSIRAFHQGALRLHTKHGGAIARMTSPVAAALIHLRMRWRMWQVSRHPAAPAASPVPAVNGTATDEPR
jgi:GT2 family glycosyltransferase